MEGCGESKLHAKSSTSQTKWPRLGKALLTWLLAVKMRYEDLASLLSCENHARFEFGAECRACGSFWLGMNFANRTSWAGSWRETKRGRNSLLPLNRLSDLETTASAGKGTQMSGVSSWVGTPHDIR